MRHTLLGFTLMTLVTLLTVTGADAFLGFGRHAAVTPENGFVYIDLAEVRDGEAHYYSLTANNKKIDFFVVQSPDGVIRAAFDACDVCYHAKKGYDQLGEFMVCNNCGMRFHSSRINVVKGGCNPAPLNRAEKDGKLVISVNDILQGAHYF